MSTARKASCISLPSLIAVLDNLGHAGPRHGRPPLLLRDARFNSLLPSKLHALLALLAYSYPLDLTDVIATIIMSKAALSVFLLGSDDSPRSLPKAQGCSILMIGPGRFATSCG